MKLHLVGLPHTQTTKDYSVCAFTQKLIKFGKMMSGRGYEIIVYSGDQNEAICDEHVQLFTTKEQEKWYGPFDQNTLPGASWDPASIPWTIFNHRAIAEIANRIDFEEDLILLTGGRASEPIQAAFPMAISCEWAAGYSGIFTDKVCFESYAWQSYLYGQLNAAHGRWFDTVIPNFFDLEEWPEAGKPEDYLLFVGRLIDGKGLDIAADIARNAERKLIVAGSGMSEYKKGKLTCEDGTIIEGNIEYVGTVGWETRTKLMHGAAALLSPTKYIEPFGAVAVEAQLCGTPAITTDWGAFPETVINGLSGYRFRTLKEGVEAVEKAVALDRSAIAQHARETYQLDAIAPLYDAWFKRLATLHQGGWYDGTDKHERRLDTSTDSSPE